MRKLLVFAVFMFIAGTVSGCNTIEGVGKDIESAGESIQNL